jgi:hypothetical protein
MSAIYGPKPVTPHFEHSLDLMNRALKLRAGDNKMEQYASDYKATVDLLAPIIGERRQENAQLRQKIAQLEFAFTQLRVQLYGRVADMEDALDDD